MTYDNCPPLVREFLFYLETIKGRSKTTVLGYYYDLTLFFRFMITQKKIDVPITHVTLEHIEQITLMDVYEFLQYVSSDRTNNAKTRSRKVSAVRMFFKYLTVTTKVLSENPVENLETPSISKTLPKFLTLDACYDLLRAVDGSFRERDCCIIIFFLNCGMRLSELCGINVEDIHENQLLLRGKGNKERMVYLNDACQYALATYLPHRSPPSQEPKHRKALFLSTRGTRLSGRQVERIVERHLQSAGLAGMGYSPHKLRHTAATMMYQHGGVDVRILQEILGHANLGTTQIYTHVSSSQMQQAVGKNPLASFTPKASKKQEDG